MKLYTDGAARGNPGEAGGGVVLENKSGKIEKFVYFGRKTNNESEYLALIEGVKLAREKEAKSLEIHLDSQLIVRQLQGKYKVKSKNLLPLYKQVRQLLDGIDWSAKHIKREKNKRADFLANLAIDSSSSPRKL